MISVKLEAATQAELERKRQHYLRTYPPQGYSTHIRKPKQHEDGTWVCTGYRWASCD